MSLPNKSNRSLDQALCSMLGYVSKCRVASAHLQLPSTCLAQLVKHGSDMLQASVKNIGRVVQRMPSAELLPELQSPDLLPGLFEAFDHHSADVRKAVTMCLMHMWQVSCLCVTDTACVHVSSGVDGFYTKLLWQIVIHPSRSHVYGDHDTILCAGLTSPSACACA